MKTTIRVISVVLVAAMLCTILASCGSTLSGKYEAGGDLLGASYTFSGKKVTVSYTVLGFARSFEGEYKIDGDQITFSFGDSDVDSKYTGTQSFEKGKTEDGAAFIKVGGIQYTKAK